MPPFVSDVFVDMYCIMSRSSTTEDLHIRNASGLVPLCTHGGGMPVATYVYGGCPHPIAFLIIRFSGILNGSTLVVAGTLVHVTIMHRAFPLS